MTTPIRKKSTWENAPGMKRDDRPSSKITATIARGFIVNEEGHEQAGVKATCGKCGHVEDSYGTGESSVKRCLIMLRKNCPMREANFYVGADGEGMRAADHFEYKRGSCELTEAIRAEYERATGTKT
jgi:hypothetical protein